MESEEEYKAQSWRMTRMTECADQPILVNRLEDPAGNFTRSPTIICFKGYE